MASDCFLRDPRALARVDPAQPTKQDCFRGDRLFLGLNSFARGQAQRVHTHGAADKFYLVLSGKARIAVGEARMVLSAGGLAWAPAGVPHGVEECLEDSVLLVGMSPPPG